MLLLLQIILAIAKLVRNNRIYLQDENGRVGLSARWKVYSPAYSDVSWIFNAPSWEVCFCKDCVLLTGFYKLPASVDSVYAEINMRIRKCDKIPRAPTDCGETISIGAYVTTHKNISIPSLQVKKANRDYINLPKSMLTTDFEERTEIFNTSNLSGKGYVQYFINAKNACLGLNNFTVYHRTFSPKTGRKQKILWISGIVSAAFILLGFFICLVMYRRRQARKRSSSLKESLATELHDQVHSGWEFPREKLKLSNTVLGSGAFGVVVRGVANGIKDFDDEVTVAVKTVKDDGFGNEDATRDLMAEINLMKLVSKHPNVVELLGCCTQSNPVSMIVEYCENGDLQGFLRSNRGVYEEYYKENYGNISINITSRQLLLFAWQIAKGMSHLCSMKITHRDLATRNILLDHQLVCKVGDFGFARDIYLNNQYIKESTDGRFPVKWMAIESLLDGISTSKSDVQFEDVPQSDKLKNSWSYGVLLWEIVTLAASPYPGIYAKEVVDFIKNGNRMQKPNHCSDDLYQLMNHCWNTEPDIRPSFNNLAISIRNMIDIPRDKEQINVRAFADHSYIVLYSDSMGSSNDDVEFASQTDAQED